MLPEMFYPCKPDIFAATYESASQPAHFASDGNEEARWVESGDNACDYCGGSGHKDDVQPLTVRDAQCCICGKRGLSTVEDGGPECELNDGRWVCSRSWYETAVDRITVPEIAALIEGRNWQVKARAQHWLRRNLSCPEDADVGALCKEYGYGAVMDAASRLWARMPHGSGAFYIGGCIGFKSDDDATAALRAIAEGR